MEQRLLVCPSCGNPMDEVTKQGVTVDRCVACGGIWLDVGELAELHPPEGITATIRGPSRLGCPVCRSPMGLVDFGEVRADWCQSCGLYFDAGEVERVGRGPAPKRTRSRRLIADEDDIPLTLQILFGALGRS